MKNKKIIILLIFVLLIILIFLYFIVKNFVTFEKNNSIYENYTPQEEISSNQMRKTSVILYYVDSNNSLKSESKNIDSVLLLNNPYKYIVSQLLEKPSSDSLFSPFPDNTAILDATNTLGCISLNFSTEILNFSDENQKNNIINCLINTLSNLNEVKSIKVLINNEPNDVFNEEYSLKK